MTSPSQPPAHFRRGAVPDAHQARRAATVLDLATGLRGRALDYGCGWGDLTARLAPQFDEIVGVDADADRVAFAQAEYAPLQFSLCAAERTGFADQSFDAIFSIVVVPFVPSADQYLDECRRLVRPGGTLVIMFPNPESLRMSIRRWRGKIAQGRAMIDQAERRQDEILRRQQGQQPPPEEPTAMPAGATQAPGESP